MTRAKIPPAERFATKYRVTASGCHEWTAARCSDGYGNFKINGRMIGAHRAAWQFARGPIPDGLQVDHVCHNRACVNVEHLRLLTPKQNTENVRGPSRNSTTRHRGVSPHQSGGYIVRVYHLGKTHYGGKFASIEKAAEAARQLRLSLFTHNDDDRR